MTALRSRGLLPRALHRLDWTRDRILLPALASLWRFEAAARGCAVGQVHFLGRPLFKVFPGSRVEIGDGAVLVSDQRRSTSGNLYGPCRLHTHSASAAILIAEDVGMNGTSIVARSRTVSIGPRSMLAPNCVIMDSPYHKAWPPEQRHDYPSSELDADVVIGDDCWIGTGCLILPGSRIGANSIIGARSVVTGEIPPNCLAVGTPARPVRRLDV